MKKTKCAVSLGMSLIIILSLFSCSKQTADIDGIFINDRKISYCTTYSELSETKENNTDQWRQGMVSGNGKQGVIASGAPYNDTLIFQNIHFIMPNNNSRNCPVTSNELDYVRQSIVSSQEFTDNASYDDVYGFHPGAALRIKQEKLKAENYIRYTDYETAETGVRYTDENGTWVRTTFTSHADNATFTNIRKSDSGTRINLTLSIDDISVMANYGDGNEKYLEYKKLAASDGSYIALAAHYPTYSTSELEFGGYATLTYIICEGGTSERVLGKMTEDSQYVAEDNPMIKITDAQSVYLITISDRTDSMGSIEDFASAERYELIENLLHKAEDIADKYTTYRVFSYNAALDRHIDNYRQEYDAVTFSLKGTPGDTSNESLIKTSRFSGKMNKELLERAYYAGRYAYICCAGYSTPRLYGMWTGEWNTGWGGKYTMDANVNLQTSSMNSSNLASAPIGYASFLLRQLDDWEENALATHGFTDAIQAPVNTDGDCAVITETCYTYPFRYWNSGASWMIEPLYETLQYYGSLQIPLSDEYNLDDLRSVLSETETDLTDEQVNAIREKGYLDLKTEILLPMLIKSANYWAQLLTPEYYTDASGKIHYLAGKTSLNQDETFCIIPSYSPENNPSGYSSPSTANTAIDIAACKNNFELLISVMKSIDSQADTSRWEYLMSKLPVYLSDSSGALKEWCCTDFTENNKHRHLSHLYCAWPLKETQNNENLKNACKQAVENRSSENEASHALIHRSLIAARLNDRTALTKALKKLVNSKIYYNSMLTNHNFDRDSCYCTDFAIGYLGIINESLLYSESGKITILPCLPENGFNYGEITGLKAAARATVTDLKWNLDEKIAIVTITSDITQSIDVSCGLSDRTYTLNFNAGESRTVDFTIM